MAAIEKRDGTICQIKVSTLSGETRPCGRGVEPITISWQLCQRLTCPRADYPDLRLCLIG
jgi:hypothetical protein